MRIAVVIPCYRVKKHIRSVLETLPDFVEGIYLVDDCCPEESTYEIDKKYERVKVIKNIVNMGVGGAVKRGYVEALKDNFEIVVKIDGDGQMSGRDIAKLIGPIINKRADYTKGNRFMRFENIKSMPLIRLFGNAALSFITKFSTGYWNVADPTNGFTAIRTSVLAEIPLNKISNRYFFESDMLFRLGMISAVVNDVPLKTVYKDEISNLKIRNIIFEFAYKNLKNYIKRILYFYYIKDLNIASFNLPLGIFLSIFGLS